MVWGRQLNGLVHGPAQMLAQDGQQVLADLVCRIAVIGHTPPLEVVTQRAPACAAPLAI